MKVKFFIVDGPLKKRGAKLDEFEAAINAWLAAHPTIRIEQVHQSSNGGSLDHTKIVVSVWYREGT